MFRPKRKAERAREIEKRNEVRSDLFRAFRDVWDPPRKDGVRYKVGWVGGFWDVWVVWDSESAPGELSTRDRNNWVKRFWREDQDRAREYAGGLNDADAISKKGKTRERYSSPEDARSTDTD